MSMRLFAGLLALALLLAGVALYLSTPGQQPVPAVQETGEMAPDAGPARTVFDISVHTLDELRVLLDRAEQLSATMAGERAGVVLVLHGPEVEFFSAGNYDSYRDVVDQAARLDAGNIVDVRICQTMMQQRGMQRNDIPAFIEQVPDGQVEINRLVGQGYVYF
jgi:intracellular sulfur oxidation DsrE/DsrF family protein